MGSLYLVGGFFIITDGTDGIQITDNADLGITQISFITGGSLPVGRYIE
jgi:hypothetical protein